MNIKINHALEANEEENIPTKKAHEENETLCEESNEKSEEKKMFLQLFLMKTKGENGNDLENSFDKRNKSEKRK